MCEIYKNLSSDDLNEEIWKDIEGYEGYYQVSNIGRIRSVDRIVKHKLGGNRLIKGKIKSIHTDSKGYSSITLYKEGKSNTLRVHRIVAIAFIPNPYNKPQINHKDENRKNNIVSNLEWCTAEENLNYGNHNKNVSNTRIEKKIGFKKVKCITTGEVFNSLKEASEFYNIDIPGISKCCKGSGKYRGILPDGTKLEWRYLDEKGNIIEPNINYKGHKKTMVRCITTGKEYTSVKEAAKNNNIKYPQNIFRCCKGERPTAGTLPDGTKLKWEFIKN